MKTLTPVAQMKDMCDIGYYIGSRTSKKIDTNYKKNGIDKARYQHPLPELMLQNKVMGFSPGLDRYNYFLEQGLFLSG